MPDGAAGVQALVFCGDVVVLPCGEDLRCRGFWILSPAHPWVPIMRLAPAALLLRRVRFAFGLALANLYGISDTRRTMSE